MPCSAATRLNCGFARSTQQLAFSLDFHLHLHVYFELQTEKEEETYLMMRSRQPLGKPLPNRREPIERFIPRSPQRIAAYIFRRLDDLQDRIVRWDAFECYTVH